MTAYRFQVVHEGIVDADDPKDAEGVALWKSESGLAAVTTVTVDQIREDESE